MVKRPVLWIVFALVCVTGAVFSYVFFPRAFPLVSVDIRMDRAEALQSGQELAERFGWGPEGYRQAASFGLVPEVQQFIELEGGGQQAFRELLEEGTFHPYRWSVRHFKELERNETRITFTPQGEPYGFRQILPEDEPGAALAVEAAQNIAEQSATSEWGINLADFDRVESSQEERPGGRIDHTFVYERRGVSFGEGRLRLRLVVGGDQLTGLTHFVEVPEAFSRRFAEMRSTNELIGMLSSLAAIVGYVLVACLIALFILFRERWVLWRQPVIWGVVVAALQALAVFNDLPLAWMGYDTALSTTNFLLQQVGFALLNFVVFAVLMSVSFMAAESMTRRAFPHHVQLWRSWSPGVANTAPVIGRTVLGYMTFGLSIGYVVLFYFFAHNVLHWWTPSDVLIQPDMLATYFPWYSAITISLQAGFWEECLFRAVPIAGAALLGKRYGRPGLWIVGAFVVQALVFGGGHAPYPTMPAYARVVELIVPSIIFGLLYLYFGLLTAIILHYVFDAVLFSIPLFAASAPGIWIDRIIAILLTLLPLLIVVVIRMRRGRAELAEKDWNRGWQPEPVAETVEEPAPSAEEIGVMATSIRRLLPIAGVVGLVVWVLFTGFTSDSNRVEIGRSEALAVAEDAKAERGIELPPPWKTLSEVRATPDVGHRFVWQEGGPEAYSELLGSYLLPARWVVRYARFEGDVADRAEEYQIVVSAEGQFSRFRHILPEARAGADLSEDEARALARAAVSEGFGLVVSEAEGTAGVREISAESAKHPERRDWTFTYEDPDNYPLEQGSARIGVVVAGDEVADLYRYVHIPEEWARDDRNRQVVPTALGLGSGILGALILIAGTVFGFIAWSRKRFSVRAFLLTLGAMVLLSVVGAINGWPAMMMLFVTAQPLITQIVILFVGLVIAFSLLGLAVGVVVGWVHRVQVDSGVHSTTLQQSVLAGVSLGALAAGLTALAGSFGPSLVPDWPDFSNASNLSPMLGAALEPIVGLLTETAMLLLVFTAVGHWTRGWTRAKVPFSVALVVLGLVLGGAGASGILGWLVSGALMGVGLLLAYILVLRHDLCIVPVMAATMIILGQAEQAVLAAYPGATVGGILTIVLVAAVAVFWAAKLRGPARVLT